jgi:hypothetical protein
MRWSLRHAALCFRRKCVASSCRVARWFTFIPKIPIWVFLEGLWMENVGIFHDHLEFDAITYIWWPFGICSLWSFWYIFPFWYVWTKKNLATLSPCIRRSLRNPSKRFEEKVSWELHCFGPFYDFRHRILFLRCGANSINLVSYFSHFSAGKFFFTSKLTSTTQ